jgi:hypothetical protein
MTEALEGTTSEQPAGRRASGLSRPALTGVAVVALLVGGAGLGLGLTDSRGSSTTTVHSCGGNTPRLTVQGTGQASGCRSMSRRVRPPPPCRRTTPR